MSTGSLTAAVDTRAQALDGWLQRMDPGYEPARPLGSDASFRRYFRTRRNGASFVVMDAPPEYEDIGPFVRVAGILGALELRAPGVLAADPAHGFLLLEDLGDQTFTRALAAGVPEAELYQLAARTLEQMQTRWQVRAASLPAAADLPAYDDALLLREARLFIDWYWPEIQGAPANPAVRSDFEQAWQAVLEGLPDIGSTLVLRDFHVDNLMLLPGQDGVAACGLLDFQDAVVGSPAYDLLSLLEDARRDVSPEVVDRILHATLAAGPWPRAEFLHHYRVLGVQRSVKIIGIFTRLARRDGKSAYQVHQPRLWRLLERGLKHPELAPVAGWFSAHFRADGRPCGR